MRHSTPGLTDKYTRPKSIDIGRAASSIPVVRQVSDKPEALSPASTGTESFSGQAPTPFKGKNSPRGKNLPIAEVFWAVISRLMT